MYIYIYIYRERERDREKERERGGREQEREMDLSANIIGRNMLSCWMNAGVWSIYQTYSTQHKWKFYYDTYLTLVFVHC